MTEQKYNLTSTGLHELKLRKKSIEDRIIEVEDLIQESSLGESTMEDYTFGQLRQERLDLINELAQINAVITNASVNHSVSSSKVIVGSQVKLVNHRICHSFQLVEEIEANPSKGRLSEVSPLGSSIMGKRVGDKVIVKTPSGNIEYSVVEIS
ncbi:GreA/GreB family elongation factor [Candidatus Dojkabacteria bacterium]|nr:GreA/GreB family elongation factor [Candidatus Dojkabacteria bacterium]